MKEVVTAGFFGDEPRERLGGWLARQIAEPIRQKLSSATNVDTASIANCLLVHYVSRRK
jgi:hypothetical protein